MHNAMIVITAAVLLTGLLYSEKKEKGRLPLKAPLSLLFVIAILLQPHPISRYFQFLLAGLIFCLCGDVCLAIPRQRMFLSGLVVFLLGHLCYVFGFIYVANPGMLTWAGSGVIFLVSSAVYFYFRPHLGSMNIPVLFYMVVITAMLCGAWSVFIDSDQTLSGRVMVVAGALLFYISDLFVARNRFVEKQFFNRLIGLPLYYAGQFILAFSVGVLK